jgi:hypothetical protein
MAEASLSVKLILRRLVVSFSSQRPVFEPLPGHVRFVVDKVALGQVFSEYLDFPCQFTFHRLLRSSDGLIQAIEFINFLK